MTDGRFGRYLETISTKNRVSKDMQISSQALVIKRNIFPLLQHCWDFPSTVQHNILR